MLLVLNMLYALYQHFQEENNYLLCVKLFYIEIKEGTISCTDANRVEIYISCKE